MAAVHLTFDNGPDPVGTPRVLEVLSRRGVTATFFVLGKHLATPEGRALAGRVRDAGHRLGNHSYSHETPLGEDPRPDAVARELARTQALLDPLWSGPRWFRPFGGGGHLGPHLFSRASVDWLVAEQMTAVLWNAVPGDWRDPDGWVATARAQVAAHPHAVVVLHDVVPDAMRHLDAFLDGLADDGHTLTDALPAAVLPIHDGAVQPSLDGLVAPLTEPGARA
jgi:peptidoglycan/xylan/chitin deacetylase (PgdA/CDA1 family)